MAGDCFDRCLYNLVEVKKRYEESNLVINKEKYHLMVKGNIVLGHQISEKGVKVDRDKVEVLEKIPQSIFIEGLRSFLGNTGF